MEEIRDMAEEYTLIAPSNFMGAKFVSIQEVWTSLPEYLRKNTNGPRMEYDAMRVRYLTSHFDHVYLDVDVELLSPIGLKGLPQNAGPGVLVGNGNPETGKKCWEAYLRLCPNFCRPASLMFSGIPRLEVPTSLFIHHYAKGNYK